MDRIYILPMAFSYASLCTGNCQSNSLIGVAIRHIFVHPASIPPPPNYPSGDSGQIFLEEPHFFILKSYGLGQTECTLAPKVMCDPDWSQYHILQATVISSGMAHDPEQASQSPWNSVCRFTGPIKAFCLYWLWKFEALRLELLGRNLMREPPKDKTLHRGEKKWNEILDFYCLDFCIYRCLISCGHRSLWANTFLFLHKPI